MEHRKNNKILFLEMQDKIIAQRLYKYIWNLFKFNMFIFIHKYNFK